MGVKSLWGSGAEVLELTPEASGFMRPAALHSTTASHCRGNKERSRHCVANYRTQPREREGARQGGSTRPVCALACA